LFSSCCLQNLQNLAKFSKNSENRQTPSQHNLLTENPKYEEYTSTALIWINQTWYKLQSVRPAVESKKTRTTRLRRWFDLSYLQSAVRLRRRPFRTLRFAVYPVSHANFASVFRKLPFRNFAFRISQITHSPMRTILNVCFPLVIMNDRRAGSCAAVNNNCWNGRHFIRI